MIGLAKLVILSHEYRDAVNLLSVLSISDIIDGLNMTIVNNLFLN